MKTLVFAIVAGIVLGSAGTWLVMKSQWGDSAQVTDTSAHVHGAEEEYYTCPMHPSVRSDRPGACPVCGMALVRKSAVQEVSGDAISDFRRVSLSPTQRVIANVTSTAVDRRTLKKEIFAAGVVEYAEPNFQHISMRFPGRLEKLYLNYVGQTVRKGDPVADVYSPEAISAQQEYLLAFEWKGQMKGPAGSSPPGSGDLLKQAEQKLLLWGFTERQINHLRQTKEIQYYVTMTSPIRGTVLKKLVHPQHYAMTGEDIYDVADLSVVWVYLDVYEKDIRHINIGQPVQVMTEAYPGEPFSGRVTFIEPVMNPETRTVRVRTEFANPRGRLKPNMYARAHIGIPIQDALVVPAAAVLATGKRNVVWVEVEPNTFEPRDVVVGATTGSFTEILSGLRQGELVAETGGFLIDSESMLRQPTAQDQHASPGAVAAAPTQRPAENSVVAASGNNEVNITVKGRYKPDIVRVKMGKPVTLNFYRDEDADCTNEVVFEGMNLRRNLPARETTTIVLNPKEPGEIAFTCGMGMVRGKLIVEK